MVRVDILATSLTLLTTLLAIPTPLTPDPAGTKNIGNAAGQQFITGACLSNADCASGCCASFSGAGICSGPAVAFQQGKQGCGFVSHASPSNAANFAGAAPTTTGHANKAKPTVASTVDESIPGAANVGNGKGKQFITGQCLSDKDCASACCATLNGAGQCSGPAVSFAAGKQGCGFVGVLA